MRVRGQLKERIPIAFKVDFKNAFLCGGGITGYVRVMSEIMLCIPNLTICLTSARLFTQHLNLLPRKQKDSRDCKPSNFPHMLTQGGLGRRRSTWAYLPGVLRIKSRQKTLVITSCKQSRPSIWEQMTRAGVSSTANWISATRLEGNGISADPNKSVSCSRETTSRSTYVHSHDSNKREDVTSP